MNACEHPAADFIQGNVGRCIDCKAIVIVNADGSFTQLSADALSALFAGNGLPQPVAP